MYFWSEMENSKKQHTHTNTHTTKLVLNRHLLKRTGDSNIKLKIKKKGTPDHSYLIPSLLWHWTLQGGSFSKWDLETPWGVPRSVK